MTFCPIMFYYRKLYMQIGRISIEDVTCILQGITFTIRYLEFGCITIYEH